MTELNPVNRQAVGAGHTVKPDESIFFINYGKELARALEKGIKFFSLVRTTKFILNFSRAGEWIYLPPKDSGRVTRVR